MNLAIGMLVVVISTGYVGRIVAMRFGVKAADSLKDVDTTDSAPLPDYVELEGGIQVHPSKVQVIGAIVALLGGLLWILYSAG